MNKRNALGALLALGVAGSPRTRAQPPPGKRRVGVLMGYAEDDPEAQVRIAVFKERLAASGWAEGRNLTLDVRWSRGDVERAARFAKELVTLKPDVILAVTTAVTAALQKETSTIPIVFAVVSDPVGSGFVKTLARPGGTITGFTNLEASLAEKWLQLIKEIAPRVTRATVMFNPETALYAEFYLQPMNAVASRIGVKVAVAKVGSDSDIDKAVSGLGREAGSSLILIPDIFMTVHRKPVVTLAAQHKVPAIYAVSSTVREGGLIAYGVDSTDLFRRAAPYVDRILRGARPADLPVQQPTLFELAVNLKTAKALGLTVPHSILVRADLVIE